ALLGLDTAVELQVTIHPVHMLVIPLVALRSQPIHHLVEAPAPVLLCQRRQLLDDLAVIRSPRFVAIGAAAQPDQAAGLPLTGCVLRHRIGRHLAPRGSRYSFFSTRSFRIWWSRLNSAYIRFKRWFSVSTSFSRRKAEASIPPYFAFHL